jgi:hypothetical protein
VYENEHHGSGNGKLDLLLQNKTIFLGAQHSHDAFIDSHSRSPLPMQTVTTTSNKRARYNMTDTDTSGDEVNKN